MGIGGERVACVALCHSTLGLVGRASCGQRCAVVIGGEAVLCVALCRCNSRGGRGMVSAVPLGLVERASSE